MQVELASIRACFEGGTPASLASADAEGLPNVVIISQVEYVDERHVALSFQFFNKTRRNILVNPHVQLMVVHPETGEQYRITARYLHTQSEGPLFERMKAKLAGIASHTGMGGVFKLLGADLYEVLDAQRLPTRAIVSPQPPANRMAPLHRACQRLAASTDLDELFDNATQALAQEFGLEHGLLLLPDAPRQRLYAVASLGYERAGVGAELVLDEGVIGVAARANAPIRINYLTQDAAYCRSVREQWAGSGAPGLSDREIAYPGLAQPHSQIALPIALGGQLPGVLFLESRQPMRFDADLEDALSVFCLQLGAQARLLRAASEAEEGAAAPAGEGPAPPADSATPLRVRYFETDGSLFLDEGYLIKGVAGAILWMVLSEVHGSGRREFSNRELRLSPALRLPDLNDNLEARLVLLRRRLAERGGEPQIEKCGRGRFRVQLARPLELTRVPR